jgi:predicted RNase H-like nuclease (RuvC/YqgF family)
MIASLFQTASGSWHIPSILIASGWVVTGVFLFFQLAANRAERIKSHEIISELENKTKPITFLQSTINEQVNKIEEQSKQVESYKHKLEEIDAKSKPRTILPNKMNILITELSKHRNESININCVLGDLEANLFASQLKYIFESSGWSVRLALTPYEPFKGLIISVKDKSIEPTVNHIHQLLRSAGFDSRATLDNRMNNDISLLVGSKE